MSELNEDRVNAALEWVAMHDGDVLDIDRLVRGIVNAYMRADILAPITGETVRATGLTVVPTDDHTSDINSSTLPAEMIKAGKSVLDRIHSNDSGDGKQDNSMVAVAVYRDMVAAAPPMVPAEIDQIVVDPEVRADIGNAGEIAKKIEDRYFSKPEKSMRRHVLRLVRMVEGQRQVIEALQVGEEIRKAGT